jgi:hypothetical protein
MRAEQSTALRTPTPEDTDAGRLVYIAALERKIIFNSIRDMKFRAALELATGVPYDAKDFSQLTFDDIQEEIAQDMSRGLGLSLLEARRRVSLNKVSSNPD